MSKKWRAAIGAVTAPTYIGGLGSYQRGLAEALGDFGVDGVFFSIFPKHPTLGVTENRIPWPVIHGVSPAKWTRISAVMLRLAARPVLHPVLELIVTAALPAKSLSKLLGKVDWIHFVGTGRDYLGFALLRLARMTGVRFTVWPAVHPRDWGDDVLDVRLYRKADAVMCQTAYEQSHLGDLGVPRGKLLLCGLPAMCLSDGNEETVRRQLDLGDRPCALFLGRRDEGKGYFALLRAWPIVLQAVPNACVLLGGPGDPQKDDLAKLPEGSFRDLGLASERTKADALAACTLFCLPSSHESFGIAYVEAWSYSKPVICGTAPACREFIEDGRSGLWSDQDPSNLAEKIVRIFQRPELARSMGEYGHAVQQKRFSWQVVADAHLSAAGLRKG
ncbi:MAG: glycosyltransferase family 4 protein [Terrimicrobiaceae bacterium]